ncbi:MAG: DUF86 domain-containing protein [Planctomycetes bacterium]|nr:DUF86 domain-containing protein [Planctomycetota bacterium]
MPPSEMDAARLWDMLTYAEEAQKALAGITFHDYLSNKERRLATERRLEMAARHVSPAFREAHPEIPWRHVIGLRNVLAHEYGEIKQEVIFRVVSQHLPALIAALRPVVPPEEEA